MQDLIVWIKRATGIGYENFTTLDEHAKKAKDILRKTDDLVVQVEQLDRDIRRRGELKKWD